MAKTGKIYYSKIEFTDEYVAEHYTFPVMFFITDNIDKIKKQITYDVTGKKSVAYFSESQEPDHILTLGPVTPTTNTLNVSVHLSGINSVRMSGVIWSKSTPDTFLFSPVTAGKLKYIILYALADTQIFYIAEGIEGTEAIFPDIPEGSLFVKSILISEFGALVEDSDDGYKLLAEDPWRNIVIGNNTPTIVVIAGSPSSSFNLLVGSGSSAPKIGGIRTKVQKNTRDGHEITFYNDSATAITFIAGSYSETPAATSFGFKTEFVLGPGKFQKFKRKNNLYEVLAVGASFPESGNNGDVLEKDSTKLEGVKWVTKIKGVTDKMLHYWDGSKWFSSGVEFVSAGFLKLKAMTFGAYSVTNSTDNRPTDIDEGTVIFVNDTKTVGSLGKGLQEFRDGAWSKLNRNLGNADLGNLVTRTFSMGAGFTFATAGNPFKFTGLLPAVTPDKVLTLSNDKILREAAVINLIETWSAASYPTQQELLDAYPAAQFVLSINTPIRKFYIKNSGFWDSVNLTTV